MIRKAPLSLFLFTALALPCALAAQLPPPAQGGLGLPERRGVTGQAGAAEFPDSIPRLLGLVFFGGPLYTQAWEVNQAVGLVGRYRLSDRMSVSGRAQVEWTAGFRQLVRFFPALDLGYALSDDQASGVMEFRAGTAVLDGYMYWTAGLAGLSRPLGAEGIGRALSVWFDTRLAARQGSTGLWLTFGLGVEFPETGRDGEKRSVSAR